MSWIHHPRFQELCGGTDGVVRVEACVDGGYNVYVATADGSVERYSTMAPPKMKLAPSRYDPLHTSVDKVGVNLLWRQLLRAHRKKGDHVVVLDTELALTVAVACGDVPAHKLHVPNPSTKVLDKVSRHARGLAVFHSCTVFELVRDAALPPECTHFFLDYCCTFNDHVRRDVEMVLLMGLLPRRHGALALTVCTRGVSRADMAARVQAFMQTIGATYGYRLGLTATEEYGTVMFFAFVTAGLDGDAGPAWTAPPDAKVVDRNDAVVTKLQHAIGSALRKRKRAEDADDDKPAGKRVKIQWLTPRQADSGDYDQYDVDYVVHEPSSAESPFYGVSMREDGLAPIAYQLFVVPSDRTLCGVSLKDMRARPGHVFPV